MPRYDLNGNLVADDDPSMVSPAQQYDPAGNPIQTPPSGHVAAPQPYSDSRPPYPQAPAQKPPSTYFDGKQFRFTNEPIASPKQKTTQWLTGLSIAFAVGIFGFVGVMKLVGIAGTLPIGKLFLILNIIVGACVGFAVRYAAGKGGTVAACLTVPVLLVSLLAGHLVYAADLIVRYPHALAGETVFSAFPRAMANLTFFHWMGVLGSLGVGVSTAFREE